MEPRASTGAAIVPPMRGDLDPQAQDGKDPSSSRSPLRDRLRNAVLKPVEPGPGAGSSEAPRSVEELEAAASRANDKERLIGLLAAPIAAAIGILVIGSLIVNDPPARLKNGHVNTLHVSLSLYHDLEIVLIVLSLLMLATAMWRKRLYLGIVTALYGLAIFNLHYWGFGVPYIMVSAWLLVRAYRLQRDLREADGVGERRGRAAGDAAARRPPKAQRALHAAHSRFAPASNGEACEQAAGGLTGAARFGVEPSLEDPGALRR